MQELIDAGYLTRNKAPKWACAHMIVLKTGKEEFWYTVDLRPVHLQTKKDVWSVPHKDPMLDKLTGTTTGLNSIS